MNASRTGKNKAPTFQTDGVCAKEPLKESVRDALSSYFAALDGHECHGLFALVMNEVEPPLLEAVLEHTDGNQTRAAMVLGINRGTLRKKLKLYHLD